MLLKPAIAATYLLARIMYDACVSGHAVLKSTAPDCSPIGTLSALATLQVPTMTLEAAAAAAHAIAGML